MENETDVIYIHPQNESFHRKESILSWFYRCFFFLLACFLILLLIIGGLLTILTSPSNLLTDYFALGGFEAHS